MLVVGVPLRIDDRLFNCGVVMHRGRLLGVVPKTYLPNYREFYEKRQFAPGLQAVAREVRLLGQDVPFGSQLLFAANAMPGFVLNVEICEDVWAPVTTEHVCGVGRCHGDCQPIGEQRDLGKADYRRMLCASQSGKMHSRLSLFRRRVRRVDHGRRLGRPRA